MTSLEAIWRCGSAESRRGATVMLLAEHDADLNEIEALSGLLPTEATVVALRGLPVADVAAARSVEAWLERAAGDVEELWLAGLGAGASVAAALLLRAPERYAGVALVRPPRALRPLLRRAALLGGVDLEVMPSGAPVEEQRNLALWFAGRFACGQRPSRMSPPPSKRSLP